MSEVVAALIGASIGAVAGLAGGGFAALASIRASQIAARAALAPKLHALADAIIRLQGAAGTAEELQRRRDLEGAWNDFGVHQRILCPSRILEVLSYVLRRAATDRNYTMQAVATVAGQAQDRAARIVGMHSDHFFRFAARRAERRIVADWLVGDARGWLGDGMRKKIAEDVGLSWLERRRIKPADPPAPSPPTS